MHDLNDMAIFARVVQQGGFSAAASALGLPKSNVSRRVARLEDALGARLLERTTRRLHLTEIGTIYLAHCRRIVEEAEEAELSVDRLLEAPRGLLRLTTSVTTGQHLLAPLLAGFMRAHPEVTVDLALTNRVVDVIEEGLDVAIRVGALADSSLIARALGESGYRFCASADYLHERGAPNDPADLAGHDCLIMRADSLPARWQLIGPGGARTATIEPRAVVDDFTTLRRIVLDGAGIALLPDYLWHGQDDARLIPILPGWSLPPVRIHAVYPSHRGATPKVRAFLDYLAENLGQMLAGA